MLSVESLPGPSCSCQVPSLKSDERASDREAVDPEAALPHFSIRGYVLTSRCKDIGTNWPFKQQYLQICLKHGVSDLLPPFEPPDSIRNHTSAKGERPQQRIDCVAKAGSAVEPDQTTQKDITCSSDALLKDLKHDSHLPSDTVFLKSSFQAQTPSLDKGKRILGQGREPSDIDGANNKEADIESIVTSHVRTERSHSLSSKGPHLENKRVSKASLEVPSSFSERVETVKEPPGKKCRLIVKFVAASEPGRTDEASSNSSMISDSMASKVCPVCKTFSSSSNTTLNAHIDQCLSMESNTSQTVSVPFKHKVKPTKKRLMTDIYTTAPHCTLEELDRRNGSNWAIDSTLVAPFRDVCPENKKPKLSPVNDSENEMEEGAVYVDSNGTKVCILSKLTSTTPVAICESSKPRKLGKEIKKDKKFKLSKKRHIVRKFSKHMKLKAPVKKLSSLSLLKNEVRPEADSKVVQDEAYHESEGLGSEMVSYQKETRRNGCRTLRRWVGSKRSSSSKQLNWKTGNKNEKPSSSKNKFVETSQSTPSLLLKFSRPSDEFTSSSKTRSMNILSTTPCGRDIRETQVQARLGNDSRWSAAGLSTESSPGCRQALPSLNCISAKRSKRMEINSQTQKKPCKFSPPPTMALEISHHRPMKRQRKHRHSDMVKTSPLLSKINHGSGDTNSLIAKRLRKRKFAKVSGKEERKLPDDYELDGSEEIIATETGTMLNQPSSGQSSVLESELEMEGTFSKENGASGSLQRFNSEDEHFSANEAFNENLEDERFVNSSAVIRSSFDGISSSPATSEPMPPEGLLAASDSTLKSWTRLVENESFIDGREILVEPLAPRCFDHQMVQCSSKDPPGTIISNVEMANQLEFRGTVDSCLQVQGINGCLTSSENIVIGVSQGSSTVASIRTRSTDDFNRAVGTESSESPVSGTSHVSHPSTEDLNLENLEPEVSETAVENDNDRRLAITEVLTSASLARTVYNGRIRNEECNQEAAAMAVIQKHDFPWDDQPCCCTRRENGHHASPLLTQGATSGTTLPVKVRQMASNFHFPNHKPIVSSSYGNCPKSVNEIRTDPQLECLSDSVARRVHSDAAARFHPSSNLGSADQFPQAEHPSSPNPVLRLMGKNLMVMNKEEGEPLQHPKVLASSSENYSNIQCPSFPKHSSGSSSPSQSTHSCQHHQLMDGWKDVHRVPLQIPSTHSVLLNFESHVHDGLKTGTHLYNHPNRLTGKNISPSTFNVEKAGFSRLHHRSVPTAASAVATHPISKTREVIVIDDSTEVEGELEVCLPSPASTLPPAIPGSGFRLVRPLSSFPPQYPFEPRELPGGLRPRFPISCPSANAQSATLHSSPSEGPLLPTHYMVPSLSAAPHHRPTVFYFPSLR